MHEKVLIMRSPIEGHGLYAVKDMRKGEKVVQYVGEIITKEETEELRDDRYVFDLNEENDIDGKVPWNPAGCANHSCDPNCEAIIYDDREVWLVARRRIVKGEELTYDYGYGLESYEEWPCRCGAEDCAGYIVAEEHRDELKRMIG